MGLRFCFTSLCLKGCHPQVHGYLLSIGLLVAVQQVELLQAHSFLSCGAFRFTSLSWHVVIIYCASYFVILGFWDKNYWNTYG